VCSSDLEVDGMSTTEVILVCAAAAVVVILIVWALMMHQRRRRLREQFGDEYDRTVSARGSKRQGERELRERADRHDEMDIRPLSQASRDRFAAEWTTAQSRFVDDPRTALAKADVLVREVMSERGYPIGGFDQRAADLSVEHSDVLGHYRAAHRTADATESGKATTEEMRQAMVHYRALFGALLDDRGSDEEVRGTRVHEDEGARRT